jgi:hypothetical protein
LEQSVTSDPNKLKAGIVRIQPGVPIILTEIPDAAPIELGQPEVQREIGKTLKAYLTAAKEMLEGRYKHLQEFAPPHMTSACRPIAFVFPEGIVVRYDRVANSELKILVGTPHTLSLDDGSNLKVSLTDGVPALSEYFLHCANDPSTYDPGDRVLRITLSARANTTGEEREIAHQKIIAVAPLPPIGPRTSGSDNLRPVPFVSVRNDFELMMEIEVERHLEGPRRRFLLRNQFRLPVGWEAIDVFPPYRAEIWKPEVAAAWAECDLLAAVVQRNVRESQLRSIDPNSAARKKFAQLISEYENLLSGNEEPLHQFIRASPGLLCPTHYRVWSKLPFGKRVTDFVFREPSGEYLLVEIEKPSHPLFRNDGQQREELTHAIDQITDWRRYIEDNLRTVQDELGLDGISSNPSCMIVIGRSASLDEVGKRKLVALQNTMPKLKIITYDDLIANAKAAVENILGPLWDAGPGVEVYLLS